MNASSRVFDKKFGESFFSSLPSEPGIYRFYDREGSLIYVGKAKNLRRRLGQYRNAKRRKKHRKMLRILQDAANVDYETCASDLEASLLEMRWIQERRPKWNVAGAFYFLYPMIGLARDGATLTFCFTTTPESFDGFELHGAFRSRWISGEAFFSLMRLLAFVGHRVKKKGGSKTVKGTYVVSFRQIPETWDAHLARFFRGESRKALEELVLALVENAAARRKSREIQEHLEALARFFRHEAKLLSNARSRAGFAAYPVSQRERDFLFLKSRHATVSPSRPSASA